MMRATTRRRALAVGTIFAMAIAGVGAVDALGGRASREISESTTGIEGRAEAGDFVAAALATGDFNGDGRADVIVGAPNEDLRRRNDAGEALVIYGSRGGIRSKDTLVNQGTPGVPGANVAGDRFGAAVAAGDFDGDGFADAAIGIPGKDVDGAADAGAVAVLYGRKKVIDGRGSIALSQAAAGLASGPGPRHHFGHALSVGDFDGDGFSDLAVGIPGDSSVAPRAGSVAVFYGGADGLSAGRAELLHQDVAGSGEKAEAGDQFGWALGAGDFNGDDADDLAVGAPDETMVAAEPSAGVVHVFDGSVEGLVTQTQVDPPPADPVPTVVGRVLSEDTPGLKGPTEAEDGFGAALAAGDFDGDGDDDLAVGVPGESKGRKLASGVVHVLEGAPAGISGVGAVRLNQAGKRVATGVDAGDEFGLALAAGDFNGNGRDDLAVGAPGERISGRNGAGLVHVFYGRPAGIRRKGAQAWQPGVDGVAGSSEANAFVGRALAAGDLDGDGSADLLIGSPGRTVSGDAAAGSFIVMYG